MTDDAWAEVYLENEFSRKEREVEKIRGERKEKKKQNKLSMAIACTGIVIALASIGSFLLEITKASPNGLFRNLAIILLTILALPMGLLIAYAMIIILPPKKKR